MASVQVEIVTPQRSVFSGEAAEVRIPGAMGEFGVLPGHTIFLSLMRAGVATVVQNGKSTRFVIGRGVAEAGPDRVVLLTDSCEAADGIDKEAAQAALADAEKALEAAEAGSENFLQAEQAAEIARARLEA